MRVLRIDTARELALCVDDDGEHHTVEIALVDAEVGTEVLVHAGVALVAVP
jgi:hydrogenase maturation factor